MKSDWKRRDFLQLMGVGGVVFGSGLTGCATRAAGGSPGAASAGAAAPPASPPSDDFFFLQLTDTHWGYKGPANPHADITLEHAIATINSADVQPDFIVFTGDLTHNTDQPTERHDRLSRVRELVSTLKVKDLRFLPGEHDAGADHGDAYRSVFGETHYSFDHKGVHFVALDNVSNGDAGIGPEQLQWLSTDLAALSPNVPVIVFAHRPLFDLAPDWDWTTKDGAAAIEVLSRRPNVTVFYGHIHQELHKTTGAIAHHSSRSLVFPLPAPGSVPKKAPLPWDPSSPDHGLGWRQIARERAATRITEIAYRE
ncbi:MAG: metallophosphoesterase [Polyangiaceae bacterium]|nr:metallophosphoesterase [Polyangiaceae bacterium]